MMYTMTLSVDHENWFFVGENPKLEASLAAFGYVVEMAAKDGDQSVYKLEDSNGDLIRYVDLT